MSCHYVKLYSHYCDDDYNRLAGLAIIFPLPSSFLLSNFPFFGCWRPLALLRQYCGSWKRRALMWQYLMTQAVLCAITCIIILCGLRSREITNLSLFTFLFFLRSTRKPRCSLQLPFWKLLHQHVRYHPFESDFKKCVCGVFKSVICFFM